MITLEQSNTSYTHLILDMGSFGTNKGNYYKIQRSDIKQEGF